MHEPHPPNHAFISMSSCLYIARASGRERGGGRDTGASVWYSSLQPPSPPPHPRRTPVTGRPLPSVPQYTCPHTRKNREERNPHVILTTISSHILEHFINNRPPPAAQDVHVPIHREEIFPVLILTEFTPFPIPPPPPPTVKEIRAP